MRRRLLQLIESCSLMYGVAAAVFAFSSVLFGYGIGAIVTFVVLSLCLIVLHAWAASTRNVPQTCSATPTWEMDTHEHAVDEALQRRTQPVSLHNEETAHDLTAI